MGLNIAGTVLVPGRAEGHLLRLTAPVCFWGGLDPATGTLSDPHHPQFGAIIADRMVAIPAIVGSSSSSQFLLESMLLDTAPRGILLGEPEIIIATAVFVGQELGYSTFPIMSCELGALQDGDLVQIGGNGEVNVRR